RPPESPEAGIPRALPAHLLERVAVVEARIRILEPAVELDDHPTPRPREIGEHPPHRIHHLELAHRRLEPQLVHDTPRVRLAARARVTDRELGGAPHRSHTAA